MPAWLKFKKMIISENELDNLIKQGIQKIPSENFTAKVMEGIESRPVKIRLIPVYTFRRMLLPLLLLIILPLTGIYFLLPVFVEMKIFYNTEFIISDFKNLLNMAYQLIPFLLTSVFSIILWSLIGDIVFLKKVKGNL